MFVAQKEKRKNVFEKWRTKYQKEEEEIYEVHLLFFFQNKIKLGVLSAHAGIIFL